MSSSRAIPRSPEEAAVEIAHARTQAEQAEAAYEAANARNLALADQNAQLQARVAALEAAQAAAPPPARVSRFHLPSSIKLEQPEKFKGGHDGDSVKNFVREMESFFELAGVSDGTWQAHYASTRLTDQAAVWLESGSWTFGGANGHSWSMLKSALLSAFVPQDYAFHARTALDSCVMRKDLRAYVKAFRTRLNRCADVEDAEALFRFVRGLSAEAQRFVRLANPTTFREAAMVAEQLAPTLEATQSGPQRPGNQPSQLPRHHPPRPSGPSPMQLGGQQGHRPRQPPRHQNRSVPAPAAQQPGPSGPSARFEGTCRFCGKYGHKWSQCRKRLQGQQGSVSHMQGQPATTQFVPVAAQGQVPVMPPGTTYLVPQPTPAPAAGHGPKNH